MKVYQYSSNWYLLNAVLLGHNWSVTHTHTHSVRTTGKFRIKAKLISLFVTVRLHRAAVCYHTERSAWYEHGNIFFLYHLVAFLWKGLCRIQFGENDFTNNGQEEKNVQKLSFSLVSVPMGHLSYGFPWRTHVSEVSTPHISPPINAQITVLWQHTWACA